LARSAEFERVYREGRSVGGRQFVVHVFADGPREGPSPAENPRLGLSVGRRVGGAVERNRVKRVVREAFWSLAPELSGSGDVVVVARPDAAELARRGGTPAVAEALRELLTRAGLLEAKA
jgi:ribonuclease P protein component